MIVSEYILAIILGILVFVVVHKVCKNFEQILKKEKNKIGRNYIMLEGND